MERVAQNIRGQRLAGQSSRQRFLAMIPVAMIPVFSRFPSEIMGRLDVLWFLLSSVVVIWDASFVLLRPHSLPGGDWHFIWKPYETYIRIDKAYGDMENTFTIGQSWLNLVEVALSFATVTLILKKNSGAVLCGFFVSALTFWKTVLYMVQYTSLCNGAHLMRHTTWAEYIFLFVVPNGVWLVFPFYFLLSYGRQLKYALEQLPLKKKL